MPIYIPSIDISIERMKKEYIERIIAIENSLFSNPWTKEAFLYEIDKNIFSYPFAAMADDKDRIAGYICTWIIYEEMHILNLAVDKPFMRNGIGERLVDFSIDMGRKREVKEVFLEVRISNIPAISLYKKIGFYIISERKDYYTHPVEDALIMKKDM
ncbi:MAG: ribosomal protein S18-alanine N-acetyltransferase [Nitrospirota bacterium]